MGRAIVREPQAFLMDEPLSNLDAKLRVSMRAQLSRLHERLGIIDHAHKNLTDLTTQVTTLRDVLANKQSRGAYGQGRMEAIIRDGLHRMYPDGDASRRFDPKVNDESYCFAVLNRNKKSLALDLKDDPSLIARYEAHHQAVWPEVQAHLRRHGVPLLQQVVAEIHHEVVVAEEVAGDEHGVGRGLGRHGVLVGRQRQGHEALPRRRDRARLAEQRLDLRAYRDFERIALDVLDLRPLVGDGR